MIYADIGLFPWGTLNAGLTNATGISFGVWSQLMGLILILGMSFFKYYPGIGTLFDILLVGFFIDFLDATGFFPKPEHLLIQMIYSIIGLFILSYGMALYMSCGLGAGPRDGLMLLLLRITGKPVRVVKVCIEMTVTLFGLILGGPFGIGTIMLALLGGPVLDCVFKWTHYNASELKQKNIFEFFSKNTLPPHN